MSQIKLKDFVSCLTSQVHRLFKHVQVNEFAVNYPKAAAEIKALEIEDNLRIFFPSSFYFSFQRPCSILGERKVRKYIIS